ncbi:MAG: hypothetical protein DRJ28_06330 [Actinobacteria bacterium]|nr:MAG: hypothetical protein DRJ28_06330 [Actinomycetota bacterium]
MWPGDPMKFIHPEPPNTEPKVMAPPTTATATRAIPNRRRRASLISPSPSQNKAIHRNVNPAPIPQPDIIANPVSAHLRDSPCVTYHSFEH